MGTKTNHKQNNRGRRADGRSFDQSRDEIIDGPPKRSCFPITFLPDQRAGEKWDLIVARPRRSKGSSSSSTTSQAHSLARRRAASIAKDVLQTRMRIAFRHEKDRYWAKRGIGFGEG